MTTEDVLGVEVPTGDPLYTILIVDDEKIVRMVAKKRLAKLQYRLLEANNGEEALAMLDQEPVDLILSDWVMPGLDGPGLCEAIKRHERYRTIHFILMTALDHPTQIAEGLSRGADDFLSKTASDHEIISRIRAGLRARQLMMDVEQSNRLLSQKQAELHSELRSASTFVRGLLPRTGEVVPGVRVEWEFLPSSHLGGDFFQVARWGDDHLGLMVLDMSGHGIGPALRAVSLSLFFNGEHMQQMFPSYDPGEILTSLNQQYPMSDDGEYFTIWVGVWQCSTRLLRYATAGHPGSIVVKRDRSSVVLGERSWPIGFSDDEVYGTDFITVNPGDRMYLFSDGIYEVMNSQGEIWGRKRLQEALEEVASQPMQSGLSRIIEQSRTWNAQGGFEDDVALLGVEF
ncbi:MAG: SpoIIE family protein phosphatase [Nitrospirota bacterium]|nr:SpoIIE family protein phosphatase [Nitrospirota bacterium]MDH5699912.1 SpoIIE family protein phosphatase [Nitrospirota bacterium]